MTLTLDFVSRSKEKEKEEVEEEEVKKKKRRWVKEKRGEKKNNQLMVRV